MTSDKKNKDIFDKDSDELFSMLRVSWNKSKEEIWENWYRGINETPVISMKRKANKWILAMAASVAILLSIGVFMNMYTTTYETLAGEHFNNKLPDGSEVYLNAESVISYKPYWFWKTREVELMGEAYFKVEKGEKFQVKSMAGITEVLGTSFNIYSRNEKYEVTCLSGKVKVQAATTQHSVILHPNEKASLQKSGQLIVEEEVDTENYTSWLSYKFVFTSAQLKEVFREIERQYDIKIILPKELNQTYTGSFKKMSSVENSLNLICKPFGLNYKKLDEKHFIISYN